VKAPASAASAEPRNYRWSMPANWWTRNRRYFLYVVREFTALPMALWVLWLLYDIRSAGSGASTFQPPRSLAFVALSAVCLAFATYHSYTFLKLAGVIIHLKVMDKTVPPRVIVLTMFGLWALASIVIGTVLIGFAR
jgi:succinate dehydrogenase subunit C